MTANKKQLREFAEKWRLVAGALEGKSDKYADGMKVVLSDLGKQFRLNPPRKPARRRRAK